MKKYWAYKHIDGGIKVKRYKDKWGRINMDEATNNDIIEDITGPFLAYSWEHAAQIAKEQLDD